MILQLPKYSGKGEEMYLQDTQIKEQNILTSFEKRKNTVL